MKDTHYVLVADKSHARVFSTQRPPKSLSLLLEKDNEEGRTRTSERLSDRGGVQQNGGMGVHSVAERHSRGDEQFVRGLCDTLDKGFKLGKCEKLVLVAPPHFLGELRQHLDKDTLGAVEKSINKELSQATEKELLSHLQDAYALK